MARLPDAEVLSVGGPRAMPLYRIELLDEYGSLHSEVELDSENDDDAIESAGRIDYPHVMHLYEEDRLVARFPERPAWGGRPS